MKKVILSITLILCFSLKAQDYTPLLADLNEWHFTTCYLGDCGQDVYYTDGDTLVNNLNYKILDGYHYISRTFLLREDINEKQVFLSTRINGIQREYLLYDFSMEIGDEIEMENPITPFPSNGGMYTLMDIQSLPLVDGSNYKHYYLSPSPGNTISTWDAVWIEGVGSLSLVNAPGGSPNFDEVGELSCAFRNGDSFYTNFEMVPTCEAQLTIAETDVLDEISVVSADGHVGVKNSQDIATASIYTLSGALVKHLENKDSSPNITMDTAQLQSGIYILTFTSTNGHNKSVKVLVE